MEEMEKLLKKQLLFTRIFAVSNIVLVLIVLFVVLKVVSSICIFLPSLFKFFIFIRIIYIISSIKYFYISICNYMFCKW